MSKPLLVLMLAVLLVFAGCSAETGGSNSTSASPSGQATGTPTVLPTTDEPIPTTDIRLTATDTPSEIPSPTNTATATSSPTATLTPTSEQKRGPAQGTEWQVEITRVIDGDTVEARFPNGTVDTLRLLGVDTPETTLSKTDPAEFEGIPESSAGKDHLFEWGKKAEKFAVNKLDGKQVRVEVDPQADRRGSFGRLLVYVYYDGGANFNKQLIEQGYARMYDSSFSKRSAFTDAESRAQSDKVGLWGFESDGSTATDTPVSGGGSGEFPTPSNDPDASDPYDCSDFDSQEQAQRYFEEHPDDKSGLDGNGDGEACESL